MSGKSIRKSAIIHFHQDFIKEKDIYNTYLFLFIWLCGFQLQHVNSVVVACGIPTRDRTRPPALGVWSPKNRYLNTKNRKDRLSK